MLSTWQSPAHHGQTCRISILQNMFKKSELALPLLKFVKDASTHQSQNKKYFIIDNPKTSHIWEAPHFLQILNLHHATWDSLDMCMYGLYDPASGLPYMKSMSLFHNCPQDSLTPISSSRQVWLVYDILSQVSSTEARQIVDWVEEKESYQANTCCSLT